MEFLGTFHLKQSLKEMFIKITEEKIYQFEQVLRNEERSENIIEKCLRDIRFFLIIWEIKKSIKTSSSELLNNCIAKKEIENSCIFVKFI